MATCEKVVSVCVLKMVHARSLSSRNRSFVRSSHSQHSFAALSSDRFIFRHFFSFAIYISVYFSSF